jgi:hypothetical protein
MILNIEIYISIVFLCKRTEPRVVHEGRLFSFSFVSTIMEHFDHLVIVLDRNPQYLNNDEWWKTKTGKSTTVVRYFDQSNQLPKELEQFYEPSTKEMWIAFSPNVDESLILNFLYKITLQGVLSYTENLHFAQPLRHAQTLHFYFALDCGMDTTCLILDKVFEGWNIFYSIRCTTAEWENFNVGYSKLKYRKGWLMIS